MFFLYDDAGPAWTYLDAVVSILFLIDMIVSFNLAYYNEKDDLVVDRCKISLRYLRTWFILDIVSLIPLGV